MAAGATPMPKEFARQLLAHEKASRDPADGSHFVAFAVCEKLRTPLGKFMGSRGYCSLLARAQVLGCADIPWLCELQINPDGSFGGLEELAPKLDPGLAAEGEVVLVGHLLALLVTFIGPALTLQLLHDVWPEWAIRVIAEEEPL
jgi:hypothetical protein